jgi:hypothetical protein
MGGYRLTQLTRNQNAAGTALSDDKITGEARGAGNEPACEGRRRRLPCFSPGTGFRFALDQDAARCASHNSMSVTICSSSGVIPSAQERQAIAAEESMNADRSSLTPFEVALTEEEEGQMFRVAYGAACVIEESAKNFDFQLPTPEEIRFLRKVGKVADEITGGRFHEICMTDGPEEKRIRRLAEQKAAVETCSACLLFWPAVCAQTPMRL